MPTTRNIPDPAVGIDRREEKRPAGAAAESGWLRDWLRSFQPEATSPHPAAVQAAVELARRLQERAAALQTASERRQQAELDRMLQTPSDKATLAQMTDQAFRTRDPARAVDHLIHILDAQGVPRFFSPIDRTLLKGFQSFGAYFPGVALPLVKEHMHKETANVILPGEREILTSHLRQRNREGLRMNVNFLGEAILSEEEAGRRLQQYLLALEWPEIEVVSIKISTLYSQISPLARDRTVQILCDRLAPLLSAATRARFTRPNGDVVSKFVYLDMEEYRDMELTAETFMRTLDRPGLESARAGLALQSYIPDSARTLRRIQEWARQRARAGKGRVTVRLVKGANLESERVEASVRGWAQAPYPTKRETDANFKRLLHEVMMPENLAAMDVGIASHNLFDVAYGILLAHQRQAFDRVQFEMLEGMANHQRRALFSVCRDVLLYAPACRKEHFINAIGYLIRRLDENTGPENFLRHAFKLEVNSPEWRKLERGFLDSFAILPGLSDAPRRTQDRRASVRPAPAPAPAGPCFVNEPDTDFALPQNGQWAQSLVATWIERCDGRAPQIPIVIGGEEIREGRPTQECLDPSRPGVIVSRCSQATAQDAARAVECAADDPDGWRRLPPSERFEVLGRVAQELRQARADLMGAALANGGKTLSESDPEVSEAVDFVEFYRTNSSSWQERPALRARGRGVVVVVSPWNFPIAIPCGGVAAALAAGNTVILKPASAAVLVAWELCQCYWRAGVSQRTLQFVPGAGTDAGRHLVNHPRVDAVILTGGTETARSLLRQNPGLDLYGETGGKNATIVTALADRDQAVKHVLHSAFSHAGQKCSATSLLLLEAEVYDDPGFRRVLCEAAGSLVAGSAWNLETRVGPLIHPPAGDLAKALQTLEPGEEWALAPRNLDGNPCLWSPGVKYGVRPGSYTHLTEFFGPVLAVMRFEKLSDAVAAVNQTGYGLTSGLESLDDREWAYWQQHIRAGNLYINRVTTGAVVLRQPFGGRGKSCFGPGMKAGGPNYVAQLMHFEDFPSESQPAVPEDPALAAWCAALRQHEAGLGAAEAGIVERLARALHSYERNVHDEFGAEHDHFRLVGQDNFRRYQACPSICVRAHPADSVFDLLARVGAAFCAGCRVAVSVPEKFVSPAIRALEETTESWGATVEFLEETDEQLAARMLDRQTDRVRYAAPDRVPQPVLEASAETGIAVVRCPVLAEGRVEMLWYLQEQSLSIDYHRYGNLGMRSGEARAPVL